MIHWRKRWGLHWPNYDAAPERTYVYVRKHLGDVDMTIAACEHRRVCIQAGGHVGLWPLKLAEYFDQVLTFEPDPALFECLRRNTASAHNIACFPFALGPSCGYTRMRPHAKAGSWTVDPVHGSVEVEVVALDWWLPANGWKHCDAVVLDIEGFEVEALKGAAGLIEAHSPAIHVEELGPHRAASAAHMESIGYVERARAGRDALYMRRGQC